tara:strand:+ start:2507 stop:4150 length:1644 start_codon:yes stop_codon:yes gene_type:complete
MALSIKLNSQINVDANHTASISAGSGVTTSTVADNYVSNTSYALTPNSGVQATVATITFTASSGYYYIEEPTYRLISGYKSAFTITSTTTKDSLGRITAKVFVIKYVNTINSLGDVISFDHKTVVLPITTNVHNNALVELKSFEIDTSDMPSVATSKTFSVKGDVGANFNLKITRSSDSKTYDFTTGTFTTAATQITNQVIDGTGEYIDGLVFPTVTVDEVYTLVFSPSLAKGTTLISSLQDTDSELTHTLTINKFKAVTITVALASASYSGSYSDLTSTTTFIGERNSKLRVEKSISFALSLSANSFTFARGYTTNVAGMNPIDFRSSVVKVKNGNQVAGTAVIFDDVDGLIRGMTLTGTGVTGSPRILSIDAENNTVIVSVAQNAQGDGGMADDASITCTYGGSETSKAISGCEFELIGIDEVTSGVLLNAATLTPVETLVNDTSVDGSDGVVVVDSVAGIKAASTTFVSGRGINAAAVAPHVDSVNTGTNTVTLSADQTLDDNTPLTFTGSSRSATLAFDLAITNFGTTNHTLTIALDSILTVS